MPASRARTKKKPTRPRGSGRPGPTYWHGGAPGRAVGDLLHPAATTGASPTGDADYADLAADVYDTGYVYITTNRDLAVAFAAIPSENQDQHNLLYRVQPLGPVQTDPDFAIINPPVSFITPTARVLAIEELPPLTEEQIIRPVTQFFYWAPGQPAYDADGYLLPSSAMREHGFTAHHLRTLGRWRHQSEAIILFSQFLEARTAIEHR